MGFFSELRKLTRPYGEEVEGEDGVIDETPINTPRPAAKSRNPFASYSSAYQNAGGQGGNLYESPAQNPQNPQTPPASGSGRYSYAQAQPQSGGRSSRREARDNRAGGGDGARVINMPGTAQVYPQLQLVQPQSAREARQIADSLKNRRSIVLNLEVLQATNENEARRLLDFLSGVAYALEGDIKQVATNTYMLMPYNVQLSGEYGSEVDNNGIYL